MTEHGRVEHGRPAGLDAEALIDLVRPLIAVVDGLGSVVDARGGAGGFLGYSHADLVGANVLDFVPPGEQDEVATYFVDLATLPLNTARLPIPFRSSLIAADGSVQPVDVIPTALPAGAPVTGWLVVIVPLALEAGASRSLDAELAGAPRLHVKQLLTEELELSNGEWISRWFLVDLPDQGPPTVVCSRSGDFGFSEPVLAAFAGGWEPWTRADDAIERLIPAAELPEPLRSVALDGGWDIVGVSAIRPEGRVVAALMRIGRSVDGNATLAVRTNVLSRIRGLLEVTTLLYGRWHERDRLVSAASTDLLTGLANRDAFTDALAARTGGIDVIYVDVDRFKEVNDAWGHAVGDRVLVEVARRIVGACRADDLVARLGGDEFVVLLGEVDHEVARAIGQRIVDDVGALLTLADGPERVSVSVGLSTGADGSDGVEIADRAMLMAKRQGRARLVTA